ncbi:MAG: hypothetical protein HGB33_09800 [Syntrophaceae bacterium]|nr:hypothetical protein [Syntrophaceae bacterium]
MSRFARSGEVQDHLILISPTIHFFRDKLAAIIDSAFLCADLEVILEPREDHAAYIASWLKALKNDKKTVFMASFHAQRATDYLHGFQPISQ